MSIWRGFIRPISRSRAIVPDMKEVPDLGAAAIDFGRQGHGTRNQ
jgi:hypothetical protein